MVLTVHLKRFSPLGKKIGHHVQYDEQLSLQPYMSDGHYGPTYSLYGVICHAGGGPNSGHYYAFVKSREGQWFEMNDDSVTAISGPPTGKKTAYMLFYLRKKGEGLEAAVNMMTPRQKPNLAGGIKKRKEREGDEGAEDTGTKVSASFIGPLLPSSLLQPDTSDVKRQKMNGADPQASLVKKKIEAAAKVALTSLGDYASESEEDTVGPTKEKNGQVSSSLAHQGPSSPPPPPPPSSPSPSSQPPLTVPVPPASFYANSKKRKTLDDDSEVHKSDARQRFTQSRSKGYSSQSSHMSLFSRSRIGDGGKRNRNRPRGV